MMYIGLKAGLEIHQQLDTTKLFCNCPSEIRDDAPDIQFKRRLRASAGETGELDVAAEYEMLKQKHFVYQGYSSSTCLVEMDCEPIHGMNKEALAIALQITLLLKAAPVDRIEVMRKTVVDGSNTSGFQRTALIARNGILQTSRGKVRIATVALEEEAAKIVERKPEYDVYNLSRLGIPLVEIATEADIISPEHAKECAEKIGMILRSTGKVKRGIGTIRQDVNVSIKGGARVEIKGAQDLRLIPKMVEQEANRQAKLLEIKSLLSDASIGKEICDISAVFKKTQSFIIKDAFAKGGKVLALRLNGFKGKVGIEIAPNRRLGKEFSEYAKAAAGVAGAIHTDELPKYDITLYEISAINKQLGCDPDDAFIFIADREEKARIGLTAIKQRAEMLLAQVPKEVRKANPDATTSFLRPMPGSARMYPETDARSVVPDLRNITIPELIEEKAERLRKEGLTNDIASQISKSAHYALFEKLSEEFKNIEPAFIANTLLNTEKELKTRFGLNVQFSEKDYMGVLSYVNEGKMAKEAVLEVMVEMARGTSITDATSKFPLFSDEELERQIKDIVAEHKGLAFGALIGKAMAKLRGKAEGRKINELVRKYVP